MKTWITWVLFGLLFFYNLIDAHLTRLLFIVAPDQTYEANPVMAFVIDTGGLNSIFAVKIFVFLIVGILLFKCQKSKRS